MSSTGSSVKGVLKSSEPMMEVSRRKWGCSANELKIQLYFIDQAVVKLKESLSAKNRI